MISQKFYSQISLCPNCQGWGTREFPSQKPNDPCPECLGKGVFLSQSDNLYICDAPTFIDYKSRKKALILKILFISIAILLLVLFLVLIQNFISNFSSF